MACRAPVGVFCLLTARFSGAALTEGIETHHLALWEFIEHRRRHDLRELRGKGRFVEDYDHKKLRGDQS